MESSRGKPFGAVCDGFFKGFGGVGDDSGSDGQFLHEIGLGVLRIDGVPLDVS